MKFIVSGSAGYNQTKYPHKASDLLPSDRLFE